MAKQSVSDLPERLSDIYRDHPQSSLPRDFVPFRRYPPSVYKTNFQEFQHEPQPEFQDELDTVHWNRNQALRPTTLALADGFGSNNPATSSTEAMPSHSDLLQQSPSPGQGPDGRDSSKRWSFGGLFRRKEKAKASTVPVSIQFESEQRPTARLPSPDSESSPESEPRTNFLRRLSKKKKKTSGDGSKPVQGFLKVPHHPAQNRRSTPEIQSWETTKCPPPNLLTGNANYSSSGSLSLSMEGSSSLSRGSRMAAKEAVKARAEARRESILIDSSSEEEWDDEGENNNRGGEGSHSSLSLRPNRRQRTSPGLVLLQNSPQRVSNPSPKIYRDSAERQVNQNVGSIPKWEARIVYTQETLPEVGPVYVRLPKQLSRQFDSNGNSQYVVESGSDDKMVTAIVHRPVQPSSSFPKNSEPIYANWRHNRIQPRETFTPPQRRDFYQLDTFQDPTPQNIREKYHAPSFFLNDYGRNQQDFPLRNQDERQWSTNQLRSTNSNYSKNLDEGWTTPSFTTYEQEPKTRKYLASPLSMKIKAGSPYLPETLYHQEQTAAFPKVGFPPRHTGGQLESSSVTEFWRRQSDSKKLGGMSSTRNSQNSKQEELLNRVGIRSADSSPHQVPKHARILHSPPHSHMKQPRLIRSTDSISSLSSFSAGNLSPNNTNPKNSTRNHTKLPGQTPHRSRRIKSTEFKISTPTPGTPGESKSACERLNVKGYSPSPPPQPKPQGISSTSTPKSPGKNLEDALNELEDMYKSLRLSDEDLLDRAERRDLPTIHQELRNKEPVPYSTPRYFRFASSLGSGSLESVATTSGSGSTDGSRRRVRAPPMRRSGVPDLVNDDMAKRKYDPEVAKITSPGDVTSLSGSYLALSPAFSPPVSPCPPGDQPPPYSPYSRRKVEPDLVVDDVAVRNIRRANSIRIIEEPQPLFGVPLGPISKAPPSDYLHVTPVERFRPLFRHLKNPDIVKDDQAFRNLRRDLSQDNSLSKNWTPRLFSPQSKSRNSSCESIFNYNIQPDVGSKKLRAVRSLSANISHIVNPPCASSSLREEIGKWNSYTDIGSPIHRSSRSLTPSRSNFREASWVEQANLDEYGLPETNYRPPSPNSNIKKKFKLLNPKPPPKASPNPNSVRRPWTDLILQSYQEDENEEPLAQNLDRNPVWTPVSEEDNEVFLNVLPTTSCPLADDQNLSNFSSDSPKNKVLPGIQLNHLPGQKERRGSYVDPRSSSLVKPDTAELKRRSWSETPKQFDSFSSAHASIAGIPRKSYLFNPLPSPKKIRQISLEGFPETIDPKQSNTEQQLEALIDALVTDANTCGSLESTEATLHPSTSEMSHDAAMPTKKKRITRSSASSLEKETKWKAAIAELESPSQSKPRKNELQTLTTENDAIKSSTFRNDQVSRLSDDIQDEPFQLKAKPRSYQKCTSEPPPDPGQNLPQGQPRGILKNRPTEDFFPLRTAKAFIHPKSDGPSYQSHSHLWNQKGTKILPSPSSKPNHCNHIDHPSEKVRSLLNVTKSKYSLAESPKTSSLTPLSFLHPQGSSPSSIPNETKRSSPGGMSGLRRLLMRESSTRKNAEETVLGRGVKKSPSTGTIGLPYWSRIASNQPSFIRKFLEKVTPTSRAGDINAEHQITTTGTLPNLSPGIPSSPSVPEKAEFFMKPKYNLPSSNWRNKYMTLKKMNAERNNLGSNTLSSNDALQRISVSNQKSSTEALKPKSFSIANRFSEVDDQSNIQPSLLRKSQSAKLMSLTANGLSFSEPSKLSLKERVEMFNQLTSIPSRVRVNALGTNFMLKRNGPVTPNSAKGFGFHSNQEIDSSYDNLTGFPLFRNHSTNNFHLTAASQATFASPLTPVPSKRRRLKCASHSADNDLSEDGEVSSGGMEVAEIISKSYENSPLVQKKFWDNPNVKCQNGFSSGEVWRRDSRHDDIFNQWSTTTDLPDVKSLKSPGFHFAKVTGESHQRDRTSTSNLLSLLTAMSSSDDMPRNDETLRYSRNSKIKS